MHTSSTSRSDTTARSVSILQLIANPSAYDEKKVRLIGFLSVLHEGTAIYLHREDYECSISKNAVWIDLAHNLELQTGQPMHARYVICEGLFCSGWNGHMDMFSGSITDVTRLEPWLGVRDLLEHFPPEPMSK